jgi:tetratricopeptide (TPR) repeat protein
MKRLVARTPAGAVLPLAAIVAVLSMPMAVRAQTQDLASAELLRSQAADLSSAGRHNEAIPLAQRALAILERAYGPRHLETARSLDNLAWLYCDTGHYTQAEPLFVRALAIYERSLGVEHLDTAAVRGRVADCYVAAGLLVRAEALLRQGFAIQQKLLEPPATRGLLSGRAFLLRDHQAPDGYGLYSFLLFDGPPRNEAERARYLKALEAYLLVLQPMTELERHRRRSQLNVTLNPVTRDVELSADLIDEEQAARTAVRILDAYDFARASAFLDDINQGTGRSGPYLVSAFPATSGARGTRLFLDMSHVAPGQVWEWTRTFCWLAAQERSWSEVALRKLALNLRNAIAIAESNASPLVRLVTPTGW